jgi:Tfp pilus assembly protein PilV
MDHRKLRADARVKASTVIEVVVSMVIIIAVFGIAMMIYANITRISLSGQKLKAQAALSQVMKDIDISEQGSNEISVINDLTIERSVKAYAGDNKLLEVDLKAYDKNHLPLAELHQLIVSTNDK